MTKAQTCCSDRCRRGELCDVLKDLLLELDTADFTALMNEVADMSLKFSEQRSKDVSG